MIKTQWLKVLKVEPKENFSLLLTWEDGICQAFSLKKLIEEKEIFWKLRYPRYFKKVSIDPLGALCWPEGEDLAPEYLELQRKSE